jgi:ubiquinone/menaquinone biosynthesis C-methylase UbiE
MDTVFAKTARYYDTIYAGKDYRAEVQRLLALINTDHRSEDKQLLDVACGTGLHLQHLKEHFSVEGLDVCQELLDIARQRNPDVLFHQADMTNFGLGKQYDIVTCLFSSIGYVKTLDKLRCAIRCMTKHLLPNGLLIVEPWFTPSTWRPNTVHAQFIDEPELKIARINTSFVEGRMSIFDLHHLIGTPKGTEHIVEHHELGLFEIDEMRAVFKEQGLAVAYNAEGLTGRGLFIGKPAASA